MGSHCPRSCVDQSCFITTNPVLAIHDGVGLTISDRHVSLVVKSSYYIDSIGYGIEHGTEHGMEHHIEQHIFASMKPDNIVIPRQQIQGTINECNQSTDTARCGSQRILSTVVCVLQHDVTKTRFDITK
jgi:hypothetical protein